MKQITVKINRYNSIKNEEDNFGSINGEIYEYYCCEKIVNAHPEIQFVDFEENKENRNGFWVSSDNSLYYQSDEIDLGEFDLLGFDENGILNWWEITRQKGNHNVIIDKIERKWELLRKLFDKINFHLVLPEKNENLQKYDENIVIMEEPDYAPFRKKEYEFVFTNNNFCKVSLLNQKARKYSYIDDLMNVSKKNYRGAGTKFESYLFERLYDLKKIWNDSFSYYDVERQKLGHITVTQNSILKNGQIVKWHKATAKEVQEIRRRIKFRWN